MKFYFRVNYFLVTLSFNFHKDSCINARVHVVNVRVHVHGFMTPTCSFVHGSSFNLKLKFTR